MIKTIIALAVSLLAVACANVPEDYDYGPPISESSGPRYANNGGA